MTSIVKHQAAIALLVTILSNFSECDYCPASAPTVSVVSKCPTNKTEWDQAASRKKCNLMSAKCGDKTPVYHCLLNQWRNETVEVCASTWYISGFCTVYNTDEMKVIDDFERDCTKLSEGKCPTRYISSEAYLYQKCYMQKSSNRSIRTEETEETNDCILSTIIAIVVTVLVLVITSLVVFITLRLKISKKAPDEECMLFCNATTQNADKNERENLLEKNDKENAEPKGLFKKDPAAEKENAVQKVNEEIRVNQTKKTAESSSCGGPVELKQKPDTVETCGVDRSKPPVVSELLAKYEPGKTRGQTPNESVTDSSNAKPKDKENTVTKRLFQKDPAAEKGNAVQKDVKQKADQTIRSHRKSINGEENVEEKENSPDPTPSETGIKAPNTRAKDPAAGTENTAQNEVDQKVDHTNKNDVEFSSHGNNTNEEENEDDYDAGTEKPLQSEEKIESPDRTSNDDPDENTKSSSQSENYDAGTEKPLQSEEKIESPDRTSNDDSDAGTEKPLQSEEKIESPDRTSNDEFKQKADDTDDGEDSQALTVQEKAKYFEERNGTVIRFQTPKAHTTRNGRKT